jgi:hypothetical protein
MKDSSTIANTSNAAGSDIHRLTSEEIGIYLYGPGYYSVVIEHWPDVSAPFHLEINWPVSAIADPEPHVLANVIPVSGSVVRGAFDFAGDWDDYDIDFIEGETLTILARSILGDPFLSIYDHPNLDDPIVTDDDSAGESGRAMLK